MSPATFFAGAIFAALVVLPAWRVHALSRSGAIAAFIVGTVTLGCGGLGAAAVLLAFFVTSVGLSRVGKRRKRELVDIGKGGARDALQVLANGGVPTVCIALAATLHSAPLTFAFCGAYAAATADTWATEIGTLMRRPPRSILTLRPIATGLSGGITLPGTLAEVAGATFIGIVGLAVGGVFGGPLPAASVLLAIPIAGIAGATADSLLGATVQELRRCESCERTCETDPHVCGAPTALVRGIPGWSNDLVNASATLVGAAVGFVLSAAG